MWKSLLCLVTVSLMVAVNVAALRSGKGRSTTIHNLASLCGCLGILCMLCVPISLLYALGSYMVGPAQGTSMFLNGALIGACACSLSSLVLSMIIWRRDAK
jgi:hypothetical protein